VLATVGYAAPWRASPPRSARQISDLEAGDEVLLRDQYALGERNVSQLDAA
jgi:hypothetical protein